MEVVDFTIEGLPDPHLIWRALSVGETTRSGDYTLLADRWYPAPENVVLRAERPRVWRPLGPTAMRWYVGGSQCIYIRRDGDPARPFGSLKEAIARIKQPAVGVVIDLRTHTVLHAFDPPAGKGDSVARRGCMPPP
jgi:hypothetical protein